MSDWRWPEDYVALDDGRLYVRPDYVPAFEARGWTTLEAILETDDCDVSRRLKERDNCRVSFSTPIPGTREEIASRGYLKRHRNRSLGPWLLSGMLGRRYVPPGRAEADAVGRCQRAGVATMAVIAAGWETGPRPWQSRSFFMSEAIESGVPADDFWKEQFDDAPVPAGADQRRRALLTALAETARKFHSANLFHRDFYWCHFFVRESEPGRFETHLIDLQRVLVGNGFRPRWLLKDLAQFLFSAPQGGWSREDRRLWFERYRGVRTLSWVDRLWFRIIAFRAELYRWKEARR